jgi:DNA helicase-2/ATP-dependent DNA helicase PcrA
MVHSDAHIFSFDTFVQNALNQSQRAAVTHPQGAVLVVAGAGSGKTRVITARMTHLMLHNNVHPHQIVALTFTNKAALEMKTRVAQFLPQHARLPFVGTFHAYCVRVLKQQREHMQHAFVSIIDTDDQEKIIKALLHKNGLQKKFTTRHVLYQISQIKNTLGSLEKMVAAPHSSIIYDLYRAYEHEKKLSKCLDFDDLLLETLTLCKTANFVRQFRQTVRHILIDEYQDTNSVQHALMKALCLDGAALAVDSLCAVGDEDQSIYSWRGATVHNIRNFAHDFPQTTIVKIEQNYRSVQSVLDVANTVIEHNQGRIAKQLWSAKKSSVNRICSLGFASEYQEADVLASVLLTLQKQNELSSTAILYRAHTQSRALEEALVKQAIPYSIIGGVQFYDRMEIKDMLAYLRLIVNPFDRISCMRIMNVPARKLGVKCEELFFNAWAQEPFCTFITVAQALIARKEITGVKSTNLKEFTDLFDGLTSTSLPSAALEAIITRTRYITHLKDTYDKAEAEERISNVNELLNACIHFEHNGLATVAEVLEEIALVQDRSTHTHADHDAVTLMTLHAAKGLEFDTVILTGLEEGLLPTSRAFNSPEAIEEERRLLYVGITRACERLLFTRTKYRYTYGTMTAQMPSRFVEELPASLVPHNEVGFLRMSDIHALLAPWLSHVSAHQTSHEYSTHASL